MIGSGFKSIRNYINYQQDDTGNFLHKIISEVKRIRSFRKTLGFLRESQWRSGEWHVDYQEKNLRELIAHAVRYVPFYREAASALKIDPDDTGSAEILRQFPIINESEIHSGFERFVSENGGERENFPVRLEDESGNTVHIPFDLSALITDKAMVARHYENSGYRIGSPVLCFVNTVEGLENEKFHFDGANNRFYLSMNNLNRKNLADYCARIKDSKADFVFGYPGSLEIFVDYILEWEIDLKFYGVVTSGEVLTDTVRNKIERAFDTKVYDLYRYTLPITGMGQCQYCDGYHLFSEYCVTELLDSDGNTVAEEGKVGRIVVTNTSNLTFPIIRLDTGDLGIYDGTRCDCGRGLARAVRKISQYSRELLVGTAGGDMKKARSVVKECEH